MPKRKHDDFEQSSSTIINDMVRFAVLRGVQQGSFRRDHIKDLVDLRRSSYSFDQLIDETNIVLRDVYSLEIQPVQSNNKTKSYTVVETLPKSVKTGLGQVWQRNSQIHGKPFDDKFYFLPKTVKSRAPLCNRELVKMGVLTMVVLLVVSSENNLKQIVLRRELEKFGLPKLENQKVSSINTDTLSLLNDFVKRGYLVEETHDKDVWYKLGWRAIQEYPLKVLPELITRVANDNSSSFADTVSTTIIRAFGDACENSRPTQEDNGNASSGNDHRGNTDSA